MDDRDISEAVNGQTWRAFRVAVAEPVRGQVCSRGE
jgi:ribosomal protein S13